MKVNTLTIKNFLSHKDSTVALANRGVVLLEGENRDRGGSNGAGKTSIIDALYWGLFGQALRPVNLKDLSYKGKGNLEVLLTLTLDDGRQVTVHRVHNHKTIKNPLHVEIDGNTIDAGTGPETQKKLNTLLRLDAKTFKHVCLFTANDQSFAALTDKGQKEIMDSILGLDRLHKALDKVNERLKDFKLKRFNLDSRITDLANQRIRVQEAIRKLEESDQGFQNTKTVRIKQAQSALLKLASQEPQWDDKDAERLQELLAKPKVSEARVHAAKLEDEHRNLSATRTKAEMQYQTAKSNYDRVVLTDPDALVASQPNCPSCNQALPASALKSLHKTYTKARKAEEEALKRYAKEMQEAQETWELIKPKLRELEAQIFALRDQVQEQQAVEVEIARLKAKLANFQAQRSTWESLLQSAKDELKRAKAQESPYKPLIDSEKANLTRLEEAYREAKAEQEALDVEQAYLDFWKLGFSNQGVKGLILDTVTPFLNERANHYLHILSGGSARVEFMTHFRKDDEVKEKFDVQAGYSLGADTYDGTSDGERRRVDIACLFALGDLAAARAGTTLELRLLDEPFGPLDAVGHGQILSLLNKEIVPKVGTILMTTHDEALSALVDKRIRVVKEGGVSRVEDN